MSCECGCVRMDGCGCIYGCGWVLVDVVMSVECGCGLSSLHPGTPSVKCQNF